MLGIVVWDWLVSCCLRPLSSQACGACSLYMTVLGAPAELTLFPFMQMVALGHDVFKDIALALIKEGLLPVSARVVVLGLLSLALCLEEGILFLRVEVLLLLKTGADALREVPLVS